MLNFEDVKENQSKAVEAYLSGRDVLMTQDRKKSYLSYRAVCDRFLQTLRIAKEMIFRLAYVKKESSLLLWVQTVQKMKTRKPQRANATLCSQPLKLCLEVIGPRFSHIEEQNRSCIH